MHAELDPGSYATGAKISDAQLAALPLTRHDWHPDWNYTLRPQAHHTQAAAPAPPAPAPPDLAWLTDPAITGLPARALDALTAALTGPAGQLREAALNRRRGYRPRQPPGNRRPPGSPSPTSSSPRSCTTATACPTGPSPPCTRSGTKTSAAT